MTTDQYLSLFFSLFDAGIPWTVIGIAVLMAIFASAWLYHRRRKRVLLPWIAACLFLMLYSTVLGRWEGSSADTWVNGFASSSGSNVHLMPFWSIGAIRDGYIETLYEKIYNVLFFVPYGVLLGAYPQPLPVGKSVRLRRVVLIGFLTSVTIELLQLITRTGTCETDDVICNTIGCGVGAVIGVGICRVIRIHRYF